MNVSWSQCWRVLAAARELGWNIPGDLALAGYDDTHVLPGPDGQNILTTVRIPLVQAGRQAAEIMLEQSEARQPPRNHRHHPRRTGRTPSRRLFAEAELTSFAVIFLLAATKINTSV